MSVKEYVKQTVAKAANIIRGDSARHREWKHQLNEFAVCQCGSPRDMISSLGSFFKWSIISVLIGAVAGGVGTLFYFCIRYVTMLRTTYGWLIWFLPLGGLAIVFLYHMGKITQPKGTDLVIEAVRSPEPIPTMMAPLIFIATAITHLFGGSAGREGAALQLGGSLGYRIGSLFRLDEKDLHVVTMCGMAACFSALFGTPLTSTLLVMEVITVGVMYYSCDSHAVHRHRNARYRRLAAPAGGAAGNPVRAGQHPFLLCNAWRWPALQKMDSEPIYACCGRRGPAHFPLPGIRPGLPGHGQRRNCRSLPAKLTAGSVFAETSLHCRDARRGVPRRRNCSRFLCRGYVWLLRRQPDRIEPLLWGVRRLYGGILRGDKLSFDLVCPQRRGFR